MVCAVGEIVQGVVKVEAIYEEDDFAHKKTQPHAGAGASAMSKLIATGLIFTTSIPCMSSYMQI